MQSSAKVQIFCLWRWFCKRPMLLGKNFASLGFGKKRFVSSRFSAWHQIRSLWVTKIRWIWRINNKEDIFGYTTILSSNGNLGNWIIHNFHVFLGHPLCPMDFPYLEWDKRGKHGDRCRKCQLDVGNSKSEYECPDGCFKVKPNPWCQDSFSGQPCRVHKGNVYYQIRCIIDKRI